MADRACGMGACSFREPRECSGRLLPETASAVSVFARANQPRSYRGRVAPAAQHAVVPSPLPRAAPAVPAPRRAARRRRRERRASPASCRPRTPLAPAAPARPGRTKATTHSTGTTSAAPPADAKDVAAGQDPQLERGVQEALQRCGRVAVQTGIEEAARSGATRRRPPSRPGQVPGAAMRLAPFHAGCTFRPCRRSSNRYAPR
jgi:hypothetical protein